MPIKWCSLVHPFAKWAYCKCSYPWLRSLINSSSFMFSSLFIFSAFTLKIPAFLIFANCLFWRCFESFKALLTSSSLEWLEMRCLFNFARNFPQKGQGRFRVFDIENRNIFTCAQPFRYSVYLDKRKQFYSELTENKIKNIRVILSEIQEIDQNVHQLPQDLPQSFCFGDVTDAMTV